MPGNRDLHDSKKDQLKLQQEEVLLNLPDVEDIPGQENIHVPDMREMADETISSDDEEGIGIWNNENNDQYISNDRFGSATKKTEDDSDNKNADNPEAKRDEEDNNIADGDDELEITDDVVSKDSEVSAGEKEALRRTAVDMDTEDNEDLYAAELDDTDFDGEKLNEEILVTGDDLDVPGAELDDADQEIGEEDEENNPFSVSDTE